MVKKVLKNLKEGFEKSKIFYFNVRFLGSNSGERELRDKVVIRKEIKICLIIYAFYIYIPNL